MQEMRKELITGFNCCASFNGHPSSMFQSRLHHAFPEIGGQGNDNEVDSDEEDDDASLLCPVARCGMCDFHEEIKNALSEKSENPMDLK